MRSRQLFMGSCLVFVFVSLLVPTWLLGDVYIKQKRHTDAFEVMGQKQPAKDEILEFWLSQNKGRIDMGEDHSVIILLDQGIMYLVDHTRMEYREVPYGSLDEIVSYSLSQSDMSAEEQAQAQQFMKGMMDMMKAEVNVEETEETREIRGWNTRKYLMKTKIMMMEGTSEIWATEDVDIDYDLYRSLGAPFMAKQPGFDQVFEEMKKIKGIAVLNVTTSGAMGAQVKSTEEVLEAVEKSAPSGTYEVSQGYKKAN